MTFGVFMHKDGSIYDDIPEVHYQFPKSYLSRAQQMVGDWIVYREPVKIPNSKRLPAGKLNDNCLTEAPLQPSSAALRSWPATPAPGRSAGAVHVPN